MRAAEYDQLRRVEDHHWWHAVLRRQVADALRKNLPPRGYLLDAGCGTGGMLSFLRESIPCLDMEGIDASPKAVKYCQERGLEVTEGRVEALPFEADEFDAVLSLDVLYHEGVQEDQALEEMVRVLRPGGVLLLNLPAFDCLRGAHDAAVFGARRYNANRVRQMLEGRGLVCETIHYWNAWLFVPLLLWRQLSRLPDNRRQDAISDLVTLPAWLNGMLTRTGRLDVWLCRLLRVPFGSSVFVMARKKLAEEGGRQP